MNVSATAVSLNVADVEASARFAQEHFGFTREMAADGFASLAHPTAGVHLAFLRVGLASFKPASIAGPAGQGLLLALVVDDLDAEFARIAAAGATVSPRPRPSPGGSGTASSPTPTGSCGSSSNG